MIFVLFYSLICPLYHHANNSISTIGYLFMCGVTYVPLLSIDLIFAKMRERVRARERDLCGLFREIKIL